MNDATDLNLSDEDIASREDIVSCDVADEALETAADVDRARAMTWGCTSIWWCFPQG